MKTIDWKNATPEQINFWRNVKGLIAWNTITPVYFNGLIAGSEFLTRLATKLYVALEVEFSASAGPGGDGGLITLYDEGDVIVHYLHQNSMAMDIADTPWLTINTVYARNLYFSRIDTVAYETMRFNGYRLTIV